MTSSGSPWLEGDEPMKNVLRDGTYSDAAAMQSMASVTCPACGTLNTEDAVFCVNHDCHKALGEFDYVLEELEAAKTWIERIADRVTEFAGRPHFVTLHVFWFVLWFAANSGEFPALAHFDEYPYSLLGIVLAIEAILITGFLLISQNRQQAYANKRAELDYELNIRSYRKLLLLERRLDALSKERGGALNLNP